MMRTIDVLRKLNEETKAEVYLVGGYVRDLLRRKQNDDLDVVVRKYYLKGIGEFLSKYGTVKKISISPTHETIRTTILLFKAFDDKTEAQIALPRRGKKQIAYRNNKLTQDAAHRDFTINSMYVPIDNIKVTAVIDYSTGKDDISNRIIRANGDATEKLVSSPIRIMRAISLAARTGYSIDKELARAIKANVNLLHKVPNEAIREEFNEIIMCKHPSKYLKLMRKLGVLRTILPELSACYGVTQEPRYHKYNVFNHCIYSCDNAERDLVLRLAALFHDIGKPATRKVIDGRITFHKHEVVSTKLVIDIMRRFRYSKEVIKDVVHLVKHHMYHYTSEYTDAAVRRFIRKSNMTEDDINNIEEFPLFKLRSAERLGNGHKKVAVTEKQKNFQQRIKEVYAETTALTIDKLDLDGNDLMAMFKLRPGKMIGDILNYLLEVVVENPKLNNKRELLVSAAGYIHDKQYNI